MKNLIPKITTITLAVIIGGCASNYRLIDPPSLVYNSNDYQNGVGLSYKHDVLIERRNNKYARKAERKDIKLIALKITNLTDTTINIGRDFVFYSEEKQIMPMEPIAIKNSIKQIVPAYMPYLLLSFVNIYVTSGTTTETFPIGLALGPGITIGNIALAGTANKNLLKELNEYNIMNRDIKKGETIYGIIGVKNIGYTSVNLKRKNE